MYDPKVGQWLSEDPIGFEAGDPNIRRYVGNSPTMFTDPTGLDAVPYPPLPDPTKDERKAIELAGGDKSLQQRIEALIRIVRRVPLPALTNTDRWAQGGSCHWWANTAHSTILDMKRLGVNLDGIAIEMVTLDYHGLSPVTWDHSFLKVTLPNGEVFYLDNSFVGGEDRIFFEIPWYLTTKEKTAEIWEKCTDAMDNMMH